MNAEIAELPNKIFRAPFLLIGWLRIYTGTQFTSAELPKSIKFSAKSLGKQCGLTEVTPATITYIATLLRSATSSLPQVLIRTRHSATHLSTLASSCTWTWRPGSRSRQTSSSGGTPAFSRRSLSRNQPAEQRPRDNCCARPLLLLPPNPPPSQPSSRPASTFLFAYRTFSSIVIICIYSPPRSISHYRTY